MKGSKTHQDPDEFAKAVGRALRRAGKRARYCAGPRYPRLRLEERKSGGGKTVDHAHGSPPQRYGSIQLAVSSSARFIPVSLIPSARTA